MNVLGISPTEILVILVVALIFVGPERLPRLAADIARTIREIRKYTGSIAAELTEVMQDFEKETADGRSQWKEIGEGLTGATRSVTDALRGAHDDIRAATAPPAASATIPPPPNGAPEPVWRDVAEPAPAQPPADPSPNGATPAPSRAEEP